METHNTVAPDELPLVLTAAEAAKVLRIGLSSTYALIRCGSLRCIRIGRKYRIPRQSIIDYLRGVT